MQMCLWRRRRQLDESRETTFFFFFFFFCCSRQKCVRLPLPVRIIALVVTVGSDEIVPFIHPSTRSLARSFACSPHTRRINTNAVVHLLLVSDFSRGSLVLGHLSRRYTIVSGGLWIYFFFFFSLWWQSRNGSGAYFFPSSPLFGLFSLNH